MQPYARSLQLPELDTTTNDDIELAKKHREPHSLGLLVGPRGHQRRCPAEFASICTKCHKQAQDHIRVKGLLYCHVSLCANAGPPCDSHLIHMLTFCLDRRRQLANCPCRQTRSRMRTSSRSRRKRRARTPRKSSCRRRRPWKTRPSCQPTTTGGAETRDTDGRSG